MSDLDQGERNNAFTAISVSSLHIAAQRAHGSLREAIGLIRGLSAMIEQGGLDVSASLQRLEAEEKAVREILWDE